MSVGPKQPCEDKTKISGTETVDRCRCARSLCPTYIDNKLTDKYYCAGTASKERAVIDSGCYCDSDADGNRCPVWVDYCLTGGLFCIHGPEAGKKS